MDTSEIDYIDDFDLYFTATDIWNVIAEHYEKVLAKKKAYQGSEYVRFGNMVVTVSLVHSIHNLIEHMENNETPKP